MRIAPRIAPLNAARTARRAVPTSPTFNHTLAPPPAGANRLAFHAGFVPFSGMGLPNQPVTLSVEQIADLNQKMSFRRHDVNNHVSLMMAAVEMIQFKPEMLDKMLVSLTEQPPKITGAIGQFSAEFEKALGITRP